MVLKIAITGGMGFAGSHIAKRLAHNHSVSVMDNLCRRGSEVNLPEFKKLGIQFIHGDIRNQNDCEQLQTADIIIDCAAQPSAIDGMKNPRLDWESNTDGVFNLLEICRKNGAAFLFFSTNKVFSGDKINSLPFNISEDNKRYVWRKVGDSPDKWSSTLPESCTQINSYAEKGIPENFSIDGGDHSIYGVSKASADMWVQEYGQCFGIPSIINRFSCLAGPNQYGKSAQGWVAWFAIAALLNKPIVIEGWGGRQVRDVLFADDLCDLIEKQIMNINSFHGEVFNVGGGMEEGFSTSLVEALDIIHELTGKTLDVSTVDKARRSDHRVYISDISKVSRMFNWQPTIKVKEGYVKILDWVHRNKTVLEQLYS